MNSSLDEIWSKFASQRNKPLWEKFPGSYRAIVVETNDPLIAYRIKFRAPDLHDSDLPVEDCPWAVPSPDMGGKRSGRWTHPCIGDWVWITFDKNHPYAPIWTGFADPTRRKLYSYPSIFGITPTSVDSNGNVLKGSPSTSVDYNDAYLPNDSRPMSHGWQDRYGNTDIHSSIGYYPSEHEESPPAPDNDPLSQSKFKSKQKPPIVNSPDLKYMVRLTKGGNMLLLGDQGYFWKKALVDKQGEFYGNFEKDEEFEIKRWKYLQRLINEDSPTQDQRRAGLNTRYGHKFEMRDVGWAQLGPHESFTRQGEYGDPRIISRENTIDQRWIKLRTKGGMLFQAYDKGFHPNNDNYIKRLLIDEVGFKSDHEDRWKDRDARWMRLVTRHGFKIVLDDRGTSKTAAEEEYPRGNGLLFKGRRSAGYNANNPSGDPRGFHLEFNERDAANQTMWCTPLGQIVEMNDRYQYSIFAASMGENWTPKWQGLDENEFKGAPTMGQNPETTSHHLKLDHANEYIRLKTRAGKGNMPSPPSGNGITGLSPEDEHQGFEARDGKNGQGPWVELVDSQNRGLWFSKNKNLGIWRASKTSDMYQWMDDNNKSIVIYNNEATGKVQIYSRNNIEVIAGQNINFEAGDTVNIKSGRLLKIQVGGAKLTMSDNRIQTTLPVDAPEMNALFCNTKPGSGGGCPGQGGGQEVGPLSPPLKPAVIAPDDRGATYNGPFKDCPREEISPPDVT